MTTGLMRVMVLGLAVLLLQSGCATVTRHPAGTAEKPVVKQLAKTTHSWNGALLPAYPQGQPEVTILRITLPPGVRLETHLHPVINAGVLLSGELTVVTTAGKTLVLKAGDPIVEVVETLHHGFNSGKAPAEILVVYAGIEGKPVTIVEPH